MAAIHISTNSYLTLLVLSLIINAGYSANPRDCTTGDISTDVERTGKTVGGKPEWKVTIRNNCRCGQSLILFDCGAFQTTEPVDPDIMRLVGRGTCIFKDGDVLTPTEIIDFNVAWDRPPAFIVRASHLEPPC